MTRFDHWLFPYFNGLAHQGPVLDVVIILFAQFLPYIMAALPLLIIISREREGKSRLRAVVSLYGGALISRFVVTEAIRFLVHSPRPFLVFPNTILLISPDNAWSFPSGHMAFYMALATSLWFYNRSLGYFFGALTVLVGIARIIAGVHWPTDILGGIVVAIITALIVEYFTRKIFPRKREAATAH